MGPAITISKDVKKGKPCLQWNNDYLFLPPPLFSFFLLVEFMPHFYYITWQNESNGGISDNRVAGAGEWSWWAIREVWGERSYQAEHLAPFLNMNYSVQVTSQWPQMWAGPWFCWINHWVKDTLVLISCDSLRKPFGAIFVSEAESLSISALTLLMDTAQRGDLSHLTSLFSHKSFWG